MSNLLQVELAHYINGHGFDTQKQDNGVVIFYPVYRASKPGEKPLPNTTLILLGIEAQFVDSYRAARAVLGY